MPRSSVANTVQRATVATPRAEGELAKKSEVKKKFKKRKFELKENVLAYWSAKEGKSAESEFSVRRRAHRCSAVCRRLVPLSLTAGPAHWAIRRTHARTAKGCRHHRTGRLVTSPQHSTASALACLPVCRQTVPVNVQATTSAQLAAQYRRQSTPRTAQRSALLYTTVLPRTVGTRQAATAHSTTVAHNRCRRDFCCSTTRRLRRTRTRGTTRSCSTCT